MKLLFTYLRSKRSLKAFCFCSLCFLILSFVSVTDWKEIKSDEAAQELLEINKRNLKIQSYSFNIGYKSYKGHYVNEAYEEQKGSVIKSGEYYRCNLMGKLTIQNKEVRIIVDSVNKQINVVNPFEDPETDINIGNYIKSMSGFKSIKRANEKNQIAFRFETNATRGAIAHEMYIENDFLRKLTIYYANEINTRESNIIKKETVYPKLCIEINNFKKVETFNKDYFNTEKYLSVKKGEIILSSAYKNYKLSDNRYRK